MLKGKGKKRRLLTVLAKLCSKLPAWCRRSWVQVLALRRLSWLPKVQLLQIWGKTTNKWLSLLATSFFYPCYLSPKSTSSLNSKCKEDSIIQTQFLAPTSEEIDGSGMFSSKTNNNCLVVLLTIKFWNRTTRTQRKYPWLYPKLHIIYAYSSNPNRAVSWLWGHHCRMTCNVCYPTQKSNISCRSENHIHQDRQPLILNLVFYPVQLTQRGQKQSSYFPFSNHVPAKIRLTQLACILQTKLLVKDDPAAHDRAVP